jgi:hypothetical protein
MPQTYDELETQTRELTNRDRSAGGSRVVDGEAA